MKELYYSYEGHDPPLYGDATLKPSLSNYYAISLESRQLINSSMEVYFNNFINMISPVYKSDGMYYSNNEEITLYGFNVNFQKKFLRPFQIASINLMKKLFILETQ